MANVTGQVEGVTDAVVPLLADHYARDPQKVAVLLAIFNGTWSGVVGWERTRHNPLTEEELRRFESYRQKFYDRHEALTRVEWADFHAMLQKMDQEKPKPPGLAALFVLSAILGALAGAVYSATTRKPAEPDESANDPTPTGATPQPQP